MVHLQFCKIVMREQKNGNKIFCKNFFMSKIGKLFENKYKIIHETTSEAGDNIFELLMRQKIYGRH